MIFTGTITADHIRASILSAVEDKVRRRLREDVSQVQAEVDSLRKELYRDYEPDRQELPSLDVNNDEIGQMPAKEPCLDQRSFFLGTNGMSVTP